MAQNTGCFFFQVEFAINSFNAIFWQVLSFYFFPGEGGSGRGHISPSFAPDGTSSAVLLTMRGSVQRILELRVSP